MSKQAIGIILIVVALGFGYIGANKVADSTKSINFIGIKIDASNEKTKTQGFIYLGIAVVFFAGGIYSLGQSRK